MPRFYTTLDFKPNFKILEGGKRMFLYAMIFDIIGKIGAVGPKTGDWPDYLAETVRAWTESARVQGDDINEKSRKVNIDTITRFQELVKSQVMFGKKENVETGNGSGLKRRSSNESGYLQFTEQRNSACCATLTAGYMFPEAAQNRV